MKPIFGIEVGGRDITDKIRGGAISMTVTDGIGLKSDTVQIVIDDQNGVVAAPSTGQTIQPYGGYEGGPIRQFGTFIVDQVAYDGYPQRITISAQAVGAKTLAKARKPKDYRKEEYPTYRKIFDEIAGEAGLSLSISSEIGSIAVEYEAQGEEDRLEFVTRLGRKLDASVSVKSGRLVVAKRGSGVSVSGASMPTIRVARGFNLLSYSATWMDKPRHSEVEATWYDRKKNERKVEREKAGDEGPTYLIREPFQSKEEAKLAAKAQANELQRAEANATFSINGDPTASAGSFVNASGIRSGVNGKWYAKTVTHSFTADGPYDTGLQCELPTAGSAGGSAASRKEQPRGGEAAAIVANRPATVVELIGGTLGDGPE